MSSTEVSITLTAIDNASSVIENVRGSLTDLQGSTGGAIGGMTGLQSSTDGAVSSMDGFTRSSSLGVGTILTLGFAVNSAIRGLIQYQQREHALESATKQVTKAEEDRNELLQKLTGNVALTADEQAHLNEIERQAAVELEAQGSSLDQAAIHYLVMNKMQIDGANIQRARIIVAKELAEADQKVADAEYNVSYNQTLAYEAGFRSIAMWTMAGATILRIPAVSAAAAGAISWLGETLGLTGSAAGLTSTELVGLGQGGISASEALALTGEGATGFTSALSTAGTVIAPLIVQGRGMVTTLGELSDLWNQNAQGTSRFNANLQALSNPILMTAQGITSFMQDLRILPQEMPSIASMMSVSFGAVGASISSSIGDAFAGARDSAVSAVAEITSAMNNIPTAKETTISVNDQASGGISSIVAGLAGIVDKIVTVTVQWIESGITALASLFGGAGTAAQTVAGTSGSGAWVGAGYGTSVTQGIYGAGGYSGYAAKYTGGTAAERQRYSGGVASYDIYGNVYGYPAYQTGIESVPETGPAIVHKGEEITPADQRSRVIQFQNQSNFVVDGRIFTTFVERKLIEQRKQSSY